MTQFAETRPAADTDGLPYCTGMVVPAAEGDLYNVSPAVPPRAPPVPLPYEQAVIATVELSLQGTPASNATYVVMQGDVGDNVWYDLAWCSWTGTTGTANFLLCNGVYVGNAVQQTRTVGTAPTPSLGAIQMVAPARIRFVGKATLGAVSSSSSSSSARASSSSGAAAAAVLRVLATIKYRLLGLR